MDATEDSQTDDVQTETHIDDTNGSSSPVLSQTPRTRSRQIERSQSRAVNTRRGRGVVRNRAHSRSRSISPGRWGACGGRNEILTAATNALHSARQNRVRATEGDQSPTRSRSRSPIDTPDATINPSHAQQQV